VEEIIEDAEVVTRVAALDIGKASLVACVRVPHEDKPGRRCQEVRTFATTTAALLELRDWLICQGVTLVVMEATSAYWKPPFYLLEDDIACQVVNARDARNVPGAPQPTSSTRSGCASSPSGACSGPRSSRPVRSASCGT
jgi:transposase